MVLTDSENSDYQLTRFQQIADFTGPLLNRRGVDRDTVPKYLCPTPRDLRDPFRLGGMQAGLQIIMDTLKKNQPIGIYGDFDVDGLTATVILADTIQLLGGQAVPYIPDRNTEGHGISERGIEQLHRQGVKLIVTVDTGITANTAVDLANSLGIKTVITDHHVPNDELPNAAAIICTKLNSAPDIDDFCGAGISFKLAQALLEANSITIPNHLFELGALGTIADHVRLTGENRLIAKLGLELLANTEHIGLSALVKGFQAKGKLNITAEDVLFYLAPLLNAPSRLDDSHTSLELLRAGRKDIAEELAKRVNDYNRVRRRMTDEALASAKQQIAKQSGENLLAILLDGYYIGLLGLIAGRLCSEYSRPALVAASVNNGLLKASMRSIPAFNIREALAKVEQPLQDFGGHPRAGGFSVEANLFNDVLKQLRQHAPTPSEEVTQKSRPEFDIEVNINSLIPLHWEFVDRMGPFGEGNPEPIFLARDVEFENARMNGLKYSLLSVDVQTANGTIYKAIGFRLSLPAPTTRKFNILFQLRTIRKKTKTNYELYLLQYSEVR